ncbi:uncharacterized protein PAC_10283 [Phialocephala subalpina]|uniref:F-box domain-containing protein n=1 Tax=Phialocephala subalpina TaxID=576137 RepID=A0A1L7X5T0_9HELO|nr:uncharacterized protein PAC_10283 [Phialocephala subalpina]
MKAATVTGQIPGCTTLPVGILQDEKNESCITTERKGQMKLIQTSGTMSSLVSDINPSDSTSDLGSTTTANTEDALTRKPVQQRRWQKLFRELPTELCLNIMAHLHKDPVSQVCLGLASRYWHDVFHMTKDEFLPAGTREYPIKPWPLNLGMQISTCEEYTWKGWYPWYDLDCSEPWAQIIQWNKSLGELLQNERWLWGDLWCCGGCLKYKPEEAFAKSEYEKSIEAKGLEEDWQVTVENVCEGITQQCRRCRAKAILLHVEKRDEWRENQIVEEERTSLGLRKLDWQNLIVDGDPLREKMTEQEFLEIVGGCEEWSEVFEQLGL